jgi:hypothetical protein
MPVFNQYSEFLFYKPYSFCSGENSLKQDPANAINKSLTTNNKLIDK